jgi:hypothetical protein
MRRIVVIAVVLCLGAGRAGVGVGHRLQFQLLSIRAGQVEPFREVVRNPHAASVQVTVLGEVLLPCGGFIDIDPLPQVVPAGGSAEWNVLFPTQVGCTGTYSVTEDVGDQYGEAQDTGTFTATP